MVRLPLALLALSLASAVAALEEEGNLPEGVLSEAFHEDDQCAAGDNQCALSALQLRGQKLAGRASEAAPAAEATAVAAVEAAAAGGKEEAPPALQGFHCLSPVSVGPVVAPGKKGMCLDDATFEHCSGEIPRYWPHTTEKITTMRLFKPWGVSPPTIFTTNRTAAWAHLKAFAVQNNVKILIGTSVSCFEEDDDNEWELTKAFMKDLGPAHFMGLAIGNELELLWMKDGKYQDKACLDRLFNKHGYINKFKERVAELDLIPGFRGLPVTAVFGMYATAGFPWVQSSNAGIKEFLEAMWKTYSTRFVFSFNLYPYFDEANKCNAMSIQSATTFLPSSQVPGSVVAVRKRMQAMGAGAAKLWVAETGWSTPQSDSVAATVKGCADFSSEATFKNFYKNFLSWDLAGADHVFYFTIHDSKNFDAPEHFGLLKECGSVMCKLQS